MGLRTICAGIYAKLRACKTLVLSVWALPFSDLGGFRWFPQFWARCVFSFELVLRFASLLDLSHMFLSYLLGVANNRLVLLCRWCVCRQLSCEVCPVFSILFLSFVLSACFLCDRRICASIWWHFTFLVFLLCSFISRVWFLRPGFWVSCDVFFWFVQVEVCKELSFGGGS